MNEILKFHKTRDQNKNYKRSLLELRFSHSFRCLCLSRNNKKKFKMKFIILLFAILAILPVSCSAKTFLNF